MASTSLRAPVAVWRRLSPPRRLQIGGLLFFLAAWEIVSASGLIYRGVVPPWLTIGAALLALLADPVFWTNLSVTLFEIAWAALIGSTAGILAGLLIGSSRFVAAVFEPLVNSIASTPKVIFLPLFYLAFGIGVGSKIAAGALSCFFPLVIGVTTGMLHVRPVLVRVGRSYGLSWLQMARLIYLPSLVEPIANGMRIAIGNAIAVCLIAETRFSYAGLGFMVIDSFNRSRFPQVYAVLIVIIGLAVTVNALLGRLAWRRWR